MSSGFISESKIEEQKKQRQEEWDRVRKDNPELPLEAPEPEIDNRCLYDKLKEQRDRKDAEYEEAHKLKNMVKVLDDDEVDFLDFVDRTKLEQEKTKRQEEAKELSQFREQLSKLREEEIQKHILNEIGLKNNNKSKSSIAAKDEVSIGSNKTSQSKLLAGIVKRKLPQPSSESTIDKEPSSSSSSNSSPNKKLKSSDISTDSTTTTGYTTKDEVTVNNEKAGNSNSSDNIGVSLKNNSNLVCIGVLPKMAQCIGVLPGLSSYSDSDSDSDSDDDCSTKETTDLCGRKIENEQKK